MCVSHKHPGIRRSVYTPTAPSFSQKVSQSTHSRMSDAKKGKNPARDYESISPDKLHLTGKSRGARFHRPVIPNCSFLPAAVTAEKLNLLQR